MEGAAKLNLRMDPGLKRALVKTADREGRTLTEITERALRDYIAKSKAADIAAQPQADQPAPTAA